MKKPKPSKLAVPDAQDAQADLRLRVIGMPTKGSFAVSHFIDDASNEMVMVMRYVPETGQGRCAQCYSAGFKTCHKFGPYCHRCGSAEELT